MSNRVIAIDGPAGSGKSTTARLVAERLGFVYLDTGAMYRSVTLIALRNEISPSDGVALTALADRIDIEFRHENGAQRTFVDGEDVTDAIRTPEVTAAVSEVSAHAGVRAVLVKRQQEYAQKSDLVTEGRDTTSVVFPDAFLKIYLVADVSERARRRVKDYERIDRNTSLEKQVADIERRDRYDSSRSASPLRQTHDAIELDTTHLTIDGQAEKVVELFRKRTQESGL